MSHSPKCLSKHFVTVVSLTVLTGFPAVAQALPPSLQLNLQQSRQAQQVLAQNSQEDQENRTELNRAKNLARQAAEAANGGLRVYRAAASMHGPTNQSPYVDNGDSWTWTVPGGPPGSTLDTIETGVTVYKGTREVVVNYITYKNVVSTVALTNNYRVTFRGVSYNYKENTSTWRYYVEELPGAQNLQSWVLALPRCTEVVDSDPNGELITLDPKARTQGMRWFLDNGFEQGEFSVTVNDRWAIGTTTVAARGTSAAQGQLVGPGCNRF